jgi:uncharacterized membrane protein
MLLPAPGKAAFMSLDAETIWQVIVAAGAVVIFLGVAVLVSGRYSANGNLTPTGGLALVGSIAVFVVVMAVAGLWLERQDFGDGES